MSYKDVRRRQYRNTKVIKRNSFFSRSGPQKTFCPEDPTILRRGF